MPFREFFTMLGLLAVTALVVMIAVEKSVDSNLDVQPLLEPAANERITVLATESTTVNEFELTLTTHTFKINGQPFEANIGAIKVQKQRGEFNSPFIELPVIRLRAQTKTPREPVLLLGDESGLSNLWTKYIPTWLLNEHDVFMIGYRDIDGIKRLKNDILTDMVEDFDEVFKALKIEKISLYSLGFGAQVAYRYGATHSQHIEKMVMISPRGFSTEPSGLTKALVDTLVVYGDLDPHISDQTLNALLHNLPQAQLVKLEPIIHIEDIVGSQSQGLSQLVRGYLREGVLDVSGFIELQVKINE